MVKAIVDRHEFSINRVIQEWGYVNDKAVMNGRLYSSKAPGASFIGVPIYFVQRALVRTATAVFGRPGSSVAVSQRSMILALRLFGVGLPICVFLFFFARYIERLTGSGAARDLLVVGLGLGSMLYPYGVIFVGHGVAAALAFSGFMILSSESAVEPRPPRLAWAGALVGLSVMFEYQVIFAAVILAGYAVARHRWDARYFLLGTLPAALALAAYHTALFGRPWDFPLGHLENPEWARLHNNLRLFGLRPPSPTVVGTILFSAGLGLFIFSPFLAVGLFGSLAVLFWTGNGEASGAGADKPEAAVIFGVTAAMVLFLAGVPNWRSGWCVGPRYIVVVAPFLATGIACCWRRTRRTFALSVITAGLAIPSVVLNVVSGAVYPHYPEPFDNPVFDLTLPLLNAGYVPYSLGWWLGLPGLWSLAPLAAATILALAIALGRPDLRPRRWALHAALAVAIASTYLLLLSCYGREPSPSEAGAAAFVRSTWEPPPRR
jgi:hypothetical protein